MQWALLSIGVIVHLILVYSIFDIYYTSPLIHGLKAHGISKDPPARRLIVISADGLRFDSFTNNPTKSPFLHSLMQNGKCVSGVSRSHVPTESRPGHVAMFAGFTEDVSAVARGWKHNPVEFDSLFNRSQVSFLWGSPDIVHLFDNLDHVSSFSYSSDVEDFASKEAHKLDEWVFDRFEEFISSNSTLIEENGSVVFLHLLGLDTNGHGMKPHSSEYLNNIQVVDSGINKVVSLIQKHFPDNKTAFIFTSDHGMTDWGSHGAGSDDEVLTPFVTWGSGVARGGARKPISQVDLAPFSAALLGLPIPSNSMGVLPIHALDVSPLYLFKSAYANFLQLKEQLVHLRNEKSNRLWFRQFERFGDHALSALEKQIVELAKMKRFQAAATMFVENASLLKSATLYYHRYDRSFLGFAVSCSFIGWVLLVNSLLDRKTDFVSLSLPVRSILRPKWPFIAAIMLAVLVMGLCRFALSHYVYVLLPIFLFSLYENISGAISATLTYTITALSSPSLAPLETFSRQFFLLIGFSLIEFLCVAIFMDRRFLSVLFAILIFLPANYKSKHTDHLCFAWRISCVCLLPFPFAPTVGQSVIPSLCILAPLLAAVALYKIQDHSWFSTSRHSLTQLQVILACSALIVFVSNYIFTQVPALLRFLCWLSLPAAFVYPIRSLPTVPIRLVNFCGYLLVPYSLLSIAYESFFLLFFTAVLLIYVRFELGTLSDSELLRLPVVKGKSTTHGIGDVTWDEWRRAILFVSFLLAALFGTGNFASMNSFDPSTLKLFMTVFSPFTMAALLIIKLAIPVLITSIGFCCILRFDASEMQRLACLVLIITDLMAMIFFYQLKDDGSWLDIGLSISKYLVSMCISVVALILLHFSNWLVTLSPRILSLDTVLSLRFRAKIDEKA